MLGYIIIGAIIVFHSGSVLKTNHLDATKAVLIILVIVITIVDSGCIKEKNTTLEPVYHSTNNSSINITTTILEEMEEPENPSNASIQSVEKKYLLNEEDEPAIKINSLSIIYYIKNFKRGILDQNYLVFNISIENKGSSALDFKSKNLTLHLGDNIFNQTTLQLNDQQRYGFSKIPQVKSKINDTTLLPGQIINGSVAFEAGSLHDRSFYLIYNSTPVDLPSFEKSMEALKNAEVFNYSIALDIPPYSADDLESSLRIDTYDPPEPDYYSKRMVAYPLIWSNWINRSGVEYFKELDSSELDRNLKRSELPVIFFVYTLEVIPGKNITMCAVNDSNPNFFIVDDKGEEITGKINSRGNGAIAIRNGMSYLMQSRKEGIIDLPEMSISNVTVVRMIFYQHYGWVMASRMNYNDQIVILDNKKNIIAVIYDYKHFVS